MMRINVTAAHIKQGHPVMAQSCPIALAVKEALQARLVGVDRKEIHVYSKRDVNCLRPTKVFELPVDAREWLIRFDDDVTTLMAQPFSFELGESRNDSA